MASPHRILRDADRERPQAERRSAPPEPAAEPHDLSPAAVIRLQQTAGNQAVQGLIAGRLARQPTTTVTFDDPDVITVPTHTVPKSAEGSGAAEINQLVHDQETNLRSTQVALLTGIDSFSDYQKFASSKDAKADYGGVVMKFAIKQIIEESVKAIGKEMPYFEKIYKITFGLVDELEKEHARAAKASSEVEARDFIVQYRQLVTDVFNDLIGQVPGVREGLQGDYGKLVPAPASPKKGAPAPQTGWVVGDQAAFLSGLRKAVTAFKVPTADQCLRVFTEAWVLKAEDQLKSRGGGDIYADGRIHLDMHIDKDGESYKIDSWPTKGRLASPRAAKTIDALSRVFESGAAKDTNDLQILKVLAIDVEDEVFGFNDHYKVIVKFRNQSTIEEVTTIPSPVDSDTVPKAPLVQARTMQLVWPEAARLGVTALRGVPEGDKI
jgi:hypothetical protein